MMVEAPKRSRKMPAEKRRAQSSRRPDGRGGTLAVHLRICRLDHHVVEDHHRSASDSFLVFGASSSLLGLMSRRGADEDPLRVSAGRASQAATMCGPVVHLTPAGSGSRPLAPGQIGADGEPPRQPAGLQQPARRRRRRDQPQRAAVPYGPAQGGEQHGHPAGVHGGDHGHVEEEPVSRAAQRGQQVLAERVGREDVDFPCGRHSPSGLGGRGWTGPYGPPIGGCGHQPVARPLKWGGRCDRSMPRWRCRKCAGAGGRFRGACSTPLTSSSPANCFSRAPPQPNSLFAVVGYGPLTNFFFFFFFCLPPGARVLVAPHADGSAFRRCPGFRRTVRRRVRLPRGSPGRWRVAPECRHAAATAGRAVPRGGVGELSTVPCESAQIRRDRAGAGGQGVGGAW